MLVPNEKHRHIVCLASLPFDGCDQNRGNFHRHQLLSAPATDDA